MSGDLKRMTEQLQAVQLSKVGDGVDLLFWRYE